MRKSQNLIIIIGAVLALLSIKYGYFHFGECDLKSLEGNTQLRAFTDNPPDQIYVFLSSSDTLQLHPTKNQIPFAGVSANEAADGIKKRPSSLKASSSKKSGSASSSLQLKASDISSDSPSRRGN